MSRYRVLIAEDSVVVRERLVSLLSSFPGLSVLGAIDTTPEAICASLSMHPDAVVIGTRAGDPVVLSLLQVIKGDRPSVFIIALSNAPCTVCRERFMAAGADLFLDKTCEFDRIGPALARASVRAHPEGLIVREDEGVGPTPQGEPGTSMSDPKRSADGHVPSPKGERE